MAVNVSEWAAAGLDAIHVAARSDSGFFAGFANLTASSTGTGSGMRRLRGAIRAPFSVAEPRRVNVRGDNGKIATFQFANDGDNTFVLEMGVTDLTFEGMAQGSAVLTLGNWDMGLRGSNQPVFENLIFLLTRNAESQETASLHDPGYENLIVFNVQALPLGDEAFADSAEGGSRYSCVANPVSKTPWGVALDTAFALKDGGAVTWNSQYRCMMHVFIGDGTATAIVVDYTPVSATATKCFNADTGAAITVSSITAGTKTITLAAAVPIGKFGVILYETVGF